MTSDPRCGTSAGYHAHRKRHEAACQPCKDAIAAWNRRYTTRRYVQRGPVLIDATGTRRRIHALMRIGWPSNLLGAELGGIGGDSVRRIAANPTVRRATAAKVADLYNRLWDKPGPSVVTAARAKAAGWPPPLAFDDDTIDDPKARPARGWALPRQPAVDDVAVQRAMRGERINLRPRERAEAVRRLTARGMSAHEIAERLHIEPRSVARIRGENRKAAA